MGKHSDHKKGDNLAAWDMDKQTWEKFLRWVKEEQGNDDD